jgi:pimeloyl-ACP methyl ester carboxylesterase
MKILRVVYDILSVIIFPIGLVRLIGWGVRSLMVKAVLNTAYTPAPGALPPGFFQRYTATPIKMTTPDGVELDGVYVRQSNSPDAKTVVFCNPNGMHMERTCPQILAQINDPSYNYIFFNYRSTGQSQGNVTPEGLLLDGYTAVMTARTVYNVAAENIIAWGYSLGGAMAAFAASQVPGVSCCNERSFATLPKEVGDIVDRIATKIAGGCLGGLAGCLASFLSWSAGWDWDVQKWWRGIEGHKWIMYHPRDNIIGYEASLTKAVREELGQDTEQVIEMGGPVDWGGCGHNALHSEADLEIHKAHMAFNPLEV